MAGEFAVEDDYSTTSGSGSRIPRAEYECDAAKAMEAKVEEIFSCPVVEDYDPVYLVCAHRSELTARPVAYESLLTVLTSDLLASFTSWKNSYNLGVYWREAPLHYPEATSRALTGFSIPAEGPDPDDWTTHTWQCVGAIGSHDQNRVAFESLQRLDDDIRRLERFDVDADASVLVLADQALLSLRERDGEDIEEWASRLASDVSGAND